MELQLVFIYFRDFRMNQICIPLGQKKLLTYSIVFRLQKEYRWNSEINPMIWDCKIIK